MIRSTIKSKLLTGFALQLFLAIIIAGYALFQLWKINSGATTVIDSALVKAELSQDILRDILEISNDEKRIFLIPSGAAESVRAEIDRTVARVNENYRNLTPLLDERGQGYASDFKRHWDLFLEKIEEAEAGRGENLEEDLAVRGSIGAEEELAAAVLTLEQLIDKNRQDIENIQISDQQRYRRASLVIVLLLIFSLLLITAFSFWIIRGVNSRILSIAGKAEQIASREHTEMNLTHTIDDELNPVVLSLINIHSSFNEVTESADQIASGNYDLSMEPRSDKDLLGNALKHMAESLKRSTLENQKHNWLSSGLNQLNGRLMGNQDVEELATNVISFLCHYLKANIGAFYLLDENEKELILRGKYAFSTVDDPKKTFAFGEGLIGQAAKEKKHIILENVENSHLRISSGVVDAGPASVLVFPVLLEEKVIGVLEIGNYQNFDDGELDFLEMSNEAIALAVHSAIARRKIQELLEETQVQSEELESQQEELRQMNEELEEQTQNLKQQQEELQMTNEELEEQTQSLEAKNKEVEAAKVEVEKKTEQLELSSKYKSEFLANMSHELRTPLNSLLILSRDLAENRTGNLDEDQVESAEIIHKSGHDLLQLINEVLDLSKVEAGKMTLNVETVDLREVAVSLQKSFKRDAAEKDLFLKIEVDPEVPNVKTDLQRLNQILKNLISNAIKFTSEGGVTLAFRRKNDEVEISVSDTGIGIKPEKQKSIFEAFQQAEGGTARRYGGTGLGLSISRELAKLLSGDIYLQSEPGKGSVFTLKIPRELEHTPNQRPVREEISYIRKSQYNEDFESYPSIEDDREHLTEDDIVLLIVEDDLEFAKILKRQANEKSFKVLTAASGEAGLKLAAHYKPHAIILDIKLPGMSGREVLARIKADREIRHIPVHVISVDERSLDPIREGAVEYLMKPIRKEELEQAFNRIENFVSRKMKNLLIIEDDANSRTAIKKLIGNGDVHCLEASTGKEALNTFKEAPVDCVVLDLGLPDMTGFELIYELEKASEKVPPIIVYTGKELSRQENEELEKYAESIIIKGVKSEERLLDETALFLHRTIKNLPEQKQEMISSLYEKESILKDKKILVVDDDMRNVFALSKVLKERKVEVIKADNGKAAIERLEKHDEIDLVLMDIMMPEMDGYEAMRRIRKQGKFRDLPIIALTAKAMRDDKQKCLDAGANDYITKPLDIPKLLSMMQVWLSK